MGDLIVMSHPKFLPAREFAAGHSAEILFFTGVRYFRMDDALEPAKVAGKRATIKRGRSFEARTTANRLRKQGLQEALA